MDQDRRCGTGAGTGDVSVSFSAVLLAGGQSSRMGRDKAFIEIDGVPLWQRQRQILKELAPQEFFIAGPAHPEWLDGCDAVVPDVSPNAGPLAGLLASLHRCSTPLLLALAVDLPDMTAHYLHRLLETCAADRGVVPRRSDRLEPLAAVYPVASRAIAEKLLRAGNYSLQAFSGECVAQQLILERPVLLHEQALFLNMNTPADLAATDQARPSFGK